MAKADFFSYHFQLSFDVSISKTKKIIRKRVKSYNICILSVDHQPEYLGGVKRVTSILGKKWQEIGHFVCYMTVCNSPIHKTKVNDIPQYFFPKPNQTFDEENIQAIIQLIREKEINILLNPHVEDKEITNLAIKVHQISGIKIISALHFSPTSTYNIVRESFFISYAMGKQPKEWVKNALLWLRFKLYKGSQIKKEEGQWLKTVANESDCFVILSEKFKSYFDQRSQNVVAIYNPIDISTNERPIKKEKKVVWCGRLDITGAKRVDRMLKIWQKVMPQHPDWNLVLLGSGDTNRINHLIKKHGINHIDVVGFCDDPNDYYKNATIVCSTSTVEGWGMVLVEGQQNGCVPCAFDSYESVHDIIHDRENGILVNPFDLNQYAEKLCRLMDDEELCSKMSAQAIQSVKRFDSSLIAQQWLNLFQSLQSKS